MNNIQKFLVSISILTLFSSCSFDNKTGIWDGSKKEKKRIADIEWNQKNIENVVKVYSSSNVFEKEVVSKKNIILSKPKKISFWPMANYNHQNYLGNIYISGIDNIFLKKKIGKDKFAISKLKTSPLIFKNNIIISDDKGTIFNINKKGKINWKKNIYKKLYKKIYKNITFAIHENILYASDNVGFVYAIYLDSGELVWVKNHGIPLKSRIKIFNNKIFLINQDNRIICLDTIKGNLIWDVRMIESFIKSQSMMALAISEEGELLSLNTAGNLVKLQSDSGKLVWSTNVASFILTNNTDFFESSDIVIDKNSIYFSTTESVYSYDLKNGYLNWEKSLNSTNIPIVDGNNIFFLTDNGYLVNLNKKTGEIIWSTYILKILKKKKRSTQMSGLILGSDKIYAVSENGYLIVCSAVSGKIEFSKKIGDNVTSAPISSDGSLYVLTENSKILGFN